MIMTKSVDCEAVITSTEIFDERNPKIKATSKKN